MGKKNKKDKIELAQALTPLTGGAGHPLSRDIPGVSGERPPPTFGLGDFNDQAMALAYGGMSPDQARQNYNIESQPPALPPPPQQQQQPQQQFAPDFAQGRQFNGANPYQAAFSPASPWATYGGGAGGGANRPFMNAY